MPFKIEKTEELKLEKKVSKKEKMAMMRKKK